jgi:PAS domain S-box-containing protein
MMNDIIDNNESVTILVVDDDELILALFTEFLENNGHTTIEAENGLEALAAFKKNRPALVLMDAHMPEMDGFQACVEIKKLPEGKKVPIIMVTALEDNKSVHRAFSVGAEEYITKPINWVVLRYRMEILLKQRRMERTIQESEERFRAIAESARESIISMDDAGHITFWNQGAEAMFGYRREEILGRSLELLIPEKFRKAHRRGFQAVLKSGHMRLAGKAVELSGLRKDNSIVPIEVSLSTWSLNGRRYFSSVIRDITTRMIVRRQRDET